ncbi:ku70-like protein [Dacryopinax primogenitus]|uniref:ATP-dependent DNA helicase II subunit 1 n=1 Tax=Dacryopinax primogenitus (strain DJM 731) TaxID=1858805 RepID=M5FXS8_DACPD|nr:ku70-like protein [Dacryopinax primogenitus]EJT98331.1 ku70-like protein [Dacryopinax primogenitus]
MATNDYSDWRLDDAAEDIEVDYSAWETTSKDAIILAIQCSESMHTVREELLKSEDEDEKGKGRGRTSFEIALRSTVELQKRKVVVGPNDSVGIVFWDTVRSFAFSQKQGDYRHMYVYKEVGLITAESIQEQMHLLARAQEKNPTYLRKRFQPSTEHMPISDMLTACNAMLRTGAPKSGTHRIFLLTDEDDPTAGLPADRRIKLLQSARTRAGDTYEKGWNIIPFFISTPEHTFDPSKFWREALSREGEEGGSSTGEGDLVSGFEELLREMQVREIPRRTLFHVPLILAEGITIDIKGYGLVTVQSKGQYKYLADRDGMLKEATVKTTYIDKDDQGEVPKTDIRYALPFGKTWGDEQQDEPMEVDETEEKKPKMRGRRGNILVVEGVPAVTRHEVLFTPERMKELRSMVLEPSIKLLGFKDRGELTFFDNVKHSVFIYPSEDDYTGSTRTFAALLQSLIKKDKIGIALSVTRRGYTPQFVALLPRQEELDSDTGAQLLPPGLHMIPFPFADDIRESAYDQLMQCTEHEKDAALAWINKLTIRAGYDADNYPNPTLRLHYKNLEAAAFNEAFDPSEFEDLTVPNYASIQKRAGKLIEQFKDSVDADKRSAGVVAVATGAKRQADTTVDEAEVRAKHSSGQINKLTVVQLTGFLRGRDIVPSGKRKAELVEQVEQYLSKHG